MDEFKVKAAKPSDGVAVWVFGWESNQTGELPHNEGENRD